MVKQKCETIKMCYSVQNFIPFDFILTVDLCCFSTYLVNVIGSPAHVAIAGVQHLDRRLVLKSLVTCGVLCFKLVSDVLTFPLTFIESMCFNKPRDELKIICVISDSMSADVVM